MKTFVAILVAVVVQAWAVMLLVGALHSEAPELPALSFRASLWLVGLVAVLVGPLASNKTQ